MKIQDSSENPQLEQGYTRIAHSLLEAILQYPFTGAETKFVFALIRLTYGWGKKERVLKIRELAQVGGFSFRHAKRLVKNLVRDQVLIRRPINRVRVVLGLNKRFSTWRLRKIPKTQNVPCTCTGMSPNE